MGLLFTKFWRLFNSRVYKVIILGLDNAGKSTILYQFVLKEAVQTSPTIGSNVEEVKWKNLHFVMWDIGGQTSVRASWTTYFSGSDFVILVIDSTDRERLCLTKQELYKLLIAEELKRSKMLIFANKQDVSGCMSVAEISHNLNLTSIRDHPWHVQPCCALTGEGLVGSSGIKVLYFYIYLILGSLKVWIGLLLKLGDDSSGCFHYCLQFLHSFV
ncbi:ADP-ribosylation factor-like protein 5B [Schistosoma japonicum]|nr:ADP-ribosylation factor-like protein 5B [Schistosoma japonicum]